MLADFRIVYFILSLIVACAGDQNETCSSPYNCGLGSPCYYGLDCSCPAGYTQTKACDPSVEKCNLYMEEDLVCYPENSCLGPNEKWKKFPHMRLVCVPTNQTMRRTGDVQEYGFQHQVDNLAYLVLAYLLIVLLIYKWASSNEKKTINLRKRSTTV